MILTNVKSTVKIKFWSRVTSIPTIGKNTSCEIKAITNPINIFREASYKDSNLDCIGNNPQVFHLR